jgi:hypothetical protein
MLAIGAILEQIESVFRYRIQNRFTVSSGPITQQDLNGIRIVIIHGKTQLKQFQ